MSFNFPTSVEIQSKLDSSESEKDFSERHVVHLYDIDGKKIVVKFMNEKEARDHVQNTILFRFFDLPFVPCDMIKVKAGLSQHAYRYDGYTVNDHAVVMPYVPGETLENLQEQFGHETLQPVYNQILRLLPNKLISICSDAQPKNIILHDNNFTMIDAEYSVIGKESRNVADMYSSMICNYKEMYADSRVPNSKHIHNIQKSLETASESFLEKLENGLPPELDNSSKIREALLGHVCIMPKINVAHCLF